VSNEGIRICRDELDRICRYSDAALGTRDQSIWSEVIPHRRAHLLLDLIALRWRCQVVALVQQHVKGAGQRTLVFPRWRRRIERTLKEVQLEVQVAESPKQHLVLRVLVCRDRQVDVVLGQHRPYKRFRVATETVAAQRRDLDRCLAIDP
jgi:hypothetical protein